MSRIKGPNWIAWSVALLAAASGIQLMRLSASDEAPRPVRRGGYAALPPVVEPPQWRPQAANPPSPSPSAAPETDQDVILVPAPIREARLQSAPGYEELPPSNRLPGTLRNRGKEVPVEPSAYRPRAAQPPLQPPSQLQSGRDQEQDQERIDREAYESGVRTGRNEDAGFDSVEHPWQGPPSHVLPRLPGIRTDNDYSDGAAAEEFVAPFQGRAAGYSDQNESPPLSGSLTELPADFVPWWDKAIDHPLRAASAPSISIGVDSLIVNALEFSPQVTALRIDPILRETVVSEENAAFDLTAFLETTYDDKNDPIGNSLTTGNNSSRFLDNIAAARGGVRQRTPQGGKYDLSQRIAYQDNNSQFFTPAPQGQTRLELNFTQPLLRGAGTAYNQSRIVLAQIDQGLSESETLSKVQEHLVQVYDTYWAVYRSRAVRLQKARLLLRAKQIQQQLEARRGVDSLRRQVLRAESAVANRRTEIARAEAAVRNAEARLRLLVNSPELKQNVQVEMLPADSPMHFALPQSMRTSAEVALQNRPDIRAAIQRMKGASVRLDVSRNELLPKLDLILSTYVAGLEGRGRVLTAVGNQYAEGGPGYGLGLNFEYPLGNRAARARRERQEWEVARALKEFEATVETGLTEVEISMREVETSHREMLARYQAMVAAETEANYLTERWRLLPGNDQTLSFLLEDVLEAQERVTEEELAFVNSQVAYMSAVVRLKRDTGVLVLAH